jgi:hypothetical protein
MDPVPEAVLVKNLVASGIEPEASGSVARNSEHCTIVLKKRLFSEYHYIITLDKLDKVHSKLQILNQKRQNISATGTVLFIHIKNKTSKFRGP